MIEVTKLGLLKRDKQDQVGLPSYLYLFKIARAAAYEVMVPREISFS